MCNTHWDDNDAKVMCKMLDYRAGEAYRVTDDSSASGPVWDTNFMCDGSEETLYECVSTGWGVSTSATCVNHENDAGVFCYRSGTGIHFEVIMSTSTRELDISSKYLFAQSTHSLIWNSIKQVASKMK